MSRAFSKPRPLRGSRRVLALSPTFKDRGQDGKFRRIARGIPDQGTLDYFLSRLNPVGRPMALELLTPYLSFKPLPPAKIESEPEASVGGPADSTSGGPADGAGAAQEPTPEVEA